MGVLHKGEYRNLNVVEINARHLRHNFSFFKHLHPQSALFPVLKSNAYGHGLVEVASLVDDFHCPYICVDSLYEAYLLQKHCKTRILIMDYTNPENYKVKHLPFSFVVYDIPTLEILNKYQKGARVHIKIDTGMHRLGVQLEDLPAFIKSLRAFPNIVFEGIMSHLADADGDDDTYTAMQLENFSKAIKMFEEVNIRFVYKHIAATAGTMKVHDPLCNAYRLGIGLYGISPLPKFQHFLKPVMKVTSHIIQVKQINQGDAVGYNRTFHAKNTMSIAVIPFGYYEGLDRRLSNTGYVTLKGIPCPIIGRVSMNMAIISLEGIEEARVGDEVCIYEADENAGNSFSNAARMANTIPYELLVKINPSIKRIIM